MKTIILTLTLLLSLAMAVEAWNPNSIMGKWKTADGKAVIQIYKMTDGTFRGDILKATPKPGQSVSDMVDENNPNPAMRKRPIIGMCILKNFVFDGDDEWEDGTVYDPENGKDYDCKMWLEDRNTLKIRGYIGISLIGRTEEWTRVE